MPSIYLSEAVTVAFLKQRGALPFLAFHLLLCDVLFFFRLHRCHRIHCLKDPKESSDFSMTGIQIMNDS